jgi:zinc protease
MNLRRTTPRAFAFEALALVFVLQLFCPSARVVRAQALAPAPRREQLLNGLRVLLVNRPGDAKVWMRLRVHSGAAFDLANKEGTMALLSDALFPDPSTPQYVAEELGGRLDVRTTYDSIEITLSGNATEFDRLAETLRNALLQMRLAPEDVQRLKEARLKVANAALQSPAALADRAIRTRLFGTYPYGRTIGGTPESLARINRGDLLFARDRFLSPNNATLVVVGGIEPARAMRTFRQFLGSWHKSEAIPPATFKQPDAPDARALIVAAPAAHEAEVRVAARGVARSDRDRVAATLLAWIVRERWLANLKEIKNANLSVVHEPHALTGTFVLGASVPAASAASAVESARAALRSFSTTPVSTAEFDKAKREVVGVDEIQRANDFPFADVWLDSITYNYDASTDARAFDGVTLADLQRVAARLFGEGQFATVVAGDAAELRAALSNLAGGVEVAGAQAAAPTPQQPAPVAPRRP